MSKTQEALKLALSVIEDYERRFYGGNNSSAGNAVRSALAEQQQEPLGTVNELFDEAVIEQCGFGREMLVYTTPQAQSSKPFDTHTAPGQFFDTHSRTPQQKLVPYEPSIDMQEQGSIASGYDLSQARAKKVYQAMIDMHDVMMEREPTDEWFRLQAGYPEQPAQQQEPEYKYCDDGKVILKNPEMLSQLLREQPAQPWVGLTETEINNITCGMVKGWVMERLVDAVEAKLKEKNT